MWDKNDKKNLPYSIKLSVYIQKTFSKPTARLCHPLPFIPSLLDAFFFPNQQLVLEKPEIYLWEPASTHLVLAGQGAEMFLFFSLIHSAFHAVFRTALSISNHFSSWVSSFGKVKKKPTALSKLFFPEPAVRRAGPISTNLPRTSFCCQASSRVYTVAKAGSELCPQLVLPPRKDTFVQRDSVSIVTEKECSSDNWIDRNPLRL